MQTGILPNPHEDTITDGAYDFYGLRLATCSDDLRIRIWEADEESGTWGLTDDWKAHEARITKLAWAHPEYDTLLASASYDCTVRVWARRTHGSGQSSSQFGARDRSVDSHVESRWTQAAVLRDAQGTVRSIAFAPPLYGLQLATISTDGILRVYEGFDRGSQWNYRAELDMSTFGSPIRTLAVLDGASATLAGGSPLLGAPMSITSSGTATPGAASLPNITPAAPRAVGRVEADGGWCLSWCRERWNDGLLLAVVAGRSNLVQILHLDNKSRPRPLLNLEPRKQTSYALTSVDWAPLMGRTHHRIAAGGRDGVVHIWQLTPPRGRWEAADDGSDSEWSIDTSEFDEHRPFGITKVEWNQTGTVLASSAHDGRVRLWKRTDGKVWRGQGWVTGETHHLLDAEGQEQLDELREHQRSQSHDIQ